MTGSCVDEGAVVAFLDGGLTPEARSAVEQHVATCPSCADLVTWAAAYRSGSTVRLAGREGRPFIGQLAPGTRVGRYQILGAVGRGGMGDVYAAYHPDLDRRIAVKVVREVDGRSDDHHARLLREARAIARLSHPNVVTVYDAGTHGDRVFIAMELIDGQTIDDWLRAAPRTWQQILDVFIAAGRGLAAAHASGIVHRDFKPQNVMIAKSGAVRVMDFGLARLTHEDLGDTQAVSDGETAATVGPVTATGAFVGTPAYMSPEQFRRDQVDARSDQFSFCVALYEALLGTRPATASADSGSPTGAGSGPLRRAAVPGWLRAIVVRGASADREERYPSMNALLAALDLSRTRTRRRLSVAVAALTVTLLSAGGWRLAHGNRFVCAVPRDRLATAWSTDLRDARRESIHRAFAASGRATAEASWQRVSKILDDYVSAWGAMYIQTCEATHVRGEQSAEVLDLRMSCLNDNLDQVRALTDALTTADAVVVSRAGNAAANLTPMSRCADVAVLKSAMPLPKDEMTLREVQRLRRALTDGEALMNVGRVRMGLERTSALRGDVESTGFKPLVGEFLATVGLLQAEVHLPACIATLENAVFIAESAGDDATAAKAATTLIYCVGNHGRLVDAERWARLASSILDRRPAGAALMRAWMANNLGALYSKHGDFQKALAFNERAIAQKEDVLGKEHPDVAISLGGRAWIFIQLERPREAIPFAERAISIFMKSGDANNPQLANPLSNKGWALLALGRPAEARACFERVLEIVDGSSDIQLPPVAEALTGLGESRLAEGSSAAAIGPLEAAHRIYTHYPPDELQGSNQFALARAIWDSGGDRRRAVRLAEAAQRSYVDGARHERAETVAAWLTGHRGLRR